MPKRLEQLSCCCRWKNFKQLPVFTVFTEAALGEELMCEREPHNQRDHYAVAVKNGTWGAVVGHFTKKNSNSVFTVFAKRRYNLPYSSLS